MNTIYFNHMVGSDSKMFPTCDYVEAYSTYNLEKIRTEDKKRIEMFKGMNYNIHETKCGIHYFNEIGYLQCVICGWTP